MPIFGRGLAVHAIREGGTGVAAVQAWHNGFLLFDGTVAVLVVGSTGEIIATGSAGVASGGITVAGVTGEFHLLAGTGGEVGGGSSAIGTTGAIELVGVDGVVTFGSVAEGETGMLEIVGVDGDTNAALPGEAIGTTGAIIVIEEAGTAGAGGLAIGTTGAVTVTAVDGVAGGGTIVEGTTGAVTATGVDGTTSTGATAIGTTGAVEVAGIAGVAGAGQTVIGTTGAVDVTGVAGTAFSFEAMRMNKSGTQSPTPFSNTQLTGFVADGAYPGTNIVSSQLKATQAGTGKTISASITWTAPFAGSVTAQVFKNGVALGTQQTGVASALNFTWTIPSQSIAVNDVFDLRFNDAAGSTVVIQPTGTYLKFE